MSTGRVLFVGCGPGAADLLTLRAAHALQTADIVIWSPSLLHRDAVLTHTRAGAEIVEWPPATQHDIDAVFDRARLEGLLVVRLKGGDPTLFGDLERDVAAVRERGLACEFVPGISAHSAAAAALGATIATDRPVLIARASALPHGRAGDAVAVYSASRDAPALQRALLERGIPASTACTVAIEVSRPGEMLLTCRIDELAETLEDMARGLLTVVVVAPPNGPADGLQDVQPESDQKLDV